MADERRRHRRRHHRRDVEEAHWEDMMEIMRNQNEATNNLIQHFIQTQQPPQQVPQQPPPPPDHQNDAGQAFTKFFKLNPPTFTGNAEAKASQHWLKAMEKIFKVVPCTEEQKVTFVTHMLAEGAENWWDGARAYMEGKEIPLDWEHFRVTFLEKYFPKIVIEKMDRDFILLQQGDTTVEEYAGKFEELYRYSSYARFVPDDDWKINQFKWGLRPDIENNLSQVNFTSFADVVHRSLVAEQSLKKLYDDRKSKWQKKKKSNSIPQDEQQETSDEEEQIQRVDTSKPIECPTCGKSHKGECKAGQDYCYYCHQSGHYIKDCLKLKKRESPDSSRLTRGRVHNLQAKKGNGVEN